MKMNLREAVHMCELRTMPQGHPDYRFICQVMWREIQSVHLNLAAGGKFVYWENTASAACSRRCGRSLKSRG
jgi:thymidylate synthase ThyX